MYHDNYTHPFLTMKNWGKTRVLIDNAGLTKPDEVVEILALYYWPKAPSPLLQTEIKVPFFFLQVAPFLQMIFVLC
jgi:hypothetical protein